MFGSRIPFSPAGPPNSNVRVVIKYAMLAKEIKIMLAQHMKLSL
jgi:hypothetical protein